MRYLAYSLVFIISFLISFLYTFPIREVLGSCLSEKGVNYGLIEGNLFSFNIKNVNYDNFKLESIEIKNRLFKIEGKINKKQDFSIFPFSKKAVFHIKNLKFENYQIKPKVYGTLKAKILKIRISDKNILITSKPEIFISKTDFPFIRNIKIKSSFIPDKTYNKLNATISSQNINGRFSGKVYLPVNMKKGKVEGSFKGKIYGSNVNKNINIKFDDLIKGRIKF